MVEELINKCNLHLNCKYKKINDITDLKLNILSRDDLPNQPELQEKIEAIKEELVLSKDPKVLIKLGELEKDKSKAKNTLAMLAIYVVKKGVINIVSSIKNKTPINSG